MRELVLRLLLLVAYSSLLVGGSPLPEAMPSPAQPDDQSARGERSANLSHITGTARKIRMYIKNGYLQLLPDGTVKGTSDQLSEYTILQRSSLSPGQLKIQGVASCMHLCMDACGLLYGSREFQDECVFNEMIEQHHYNTYSSAKYSNQRRTLYLALNKAGLPRRVLIKAKTSLGKLSAYTRVLTQTLTTSVRLPTTCPPAPAEVESRRCRRRRKKKKRRRCPENGKKPCKNADDGDDESGEEANHKRMTVVRRKCEDENCRTKKLHIGRKRKSRLEAVQAAKHHTRHLHHLRHRGIPDDLDPDDLIDDHDATTNLPPVDDDLTTEFLLLDANDK